MTASVDAYFRRQNVVDVDAAVVGVGRERCEMARDGEDASTRARAVMSEKRFDVLPIEAADGKILEYFRTTRWNDFSSIERCRVTYADVLPWHTGIREVIRSLAERDRTFFFLTHEHDIAGLLTVANLNARQVRIYLYSLLSDLETRLGSFIRVRLAAERLQHAVDSSPQAGRYRSDRTKGVEADPLEYLGFSDLIDLASNSGLLGELNVSTPEDLDVRQLRVLRNKIAHPIKSVAGELTSVKGLWSWVQLVEELIFGLTLLDPPALVRNPHPPG